VSFENVVLEEHHIYYGKHLQKMIKLFNKWTVFKTSEVWQFSKWCSGKYR